MDSRVPSRGKAAGRWVSAAAVCGLVAPAGAGAADASVSVGDNFFSPAAVTIAVGDSVTWTDAAGGNPHNVNFDGGLFDPPPAPSSAGWSLARTFTTVGSFSYVCDVHSNMDGTVTVTAAPPAPGTPPPPGGGPTTPGTPGDPGTPGGDEPDTKITLKVSDRTPRDGSRVRFYGRVTPADDGKVKIQKRRRGGSFKTVASARLKDAGARSTYSRRLKIKADGVYRARFGQAFSRKRKLDVSG
jgi:plastocyanin